MIARIPSYIHVEPVENERDEADILRDQDETDLVERAEDEALMGAVPLEQLSSDSTGAFARGELDVKEQMDRASREIEFPNRAGQKRPNLRA